MSLFGMQEAVLQSAAEFSKDERYRWSLMRQWGKPLNEGGRACLFIMLNPSTADAQKDDSTVAKCQRFARKWGYDGLRVANIFAWRATDPRELAKAADPIGEENDGHIVNAVQHSDIVICAWGTWGAHRGRGQQVRKLLHSVKLHYLRLTAKGEPWHPLYLPESLTPEVWKI